MRRKMQHRPRHYVPQRMLNEKPAVRSLNIQEAVTVLGGLTGIVVAILWIAGRFYAIGYFNAMNIPSSQINFSVWEYAELSWLRLIFYFLKRISPFLLLVATVPITILFSTYLLQRLFPRLKFVAAVKNTITRMEGLQVTITWLLTVSLVIYFSYLLLGTLIDIRQSGLQDGKKIVFSNSYAVQVYSKDYLPLGSPKISSDSSPALLEYSGLRLLTFNNGKYYLFRDIDSNTCRPSHVFIVTDSPDILIVLSAVDPVVTPCGTTPTASPGPD